MTTPTEPTDAASTSSTEQPNLAPPVPPTPTYPEPMSTRPYRRIRRSRDDRVIAGVAGGMGRYFAIDPVIFRILFVALILFGGSGLLFYLFAWFAVPVDGSDVAPISRVVDRFRRRR